MMRTRVLAVLAAATFALAGCGGGSEDDVSDLSAKEILAKSKAAAKDADSLTVEGEGQTGTTRIEVDMEFTKTTGEGSISADDAEIELLSVDDKTYFKAGPEVYSQFGANGDQIARTIGDKWILASGDAFKQIVTFANRDSFIDQLLTPDTAPTKTKGKKVEGVDCVGLTTKTGTLYVDRSDARPIRLDPEGGSGKLTFDYDDVDPAKAPQADDVFELGALG
ncbi:hypothetical protein [Aeromicrobium yanjiei]|uniref:Lipoprotein n=1 Tax=Aeromicrobium yanjiei TaxID=2662028 RepID=A0A5Q2MM90_9ACTN|nr:hypothetical protein [Aeromicrobium yanjiei]QGG43029.1 hypothetical protein GEV26_17505 [Aeromicrobium yanjiei]